MLKFCKKPHKNAGKCWFFSRKLQKPGLNRFSWENKMQKSARQGAFFGARGEGRGEGI
jgi:hypothetical protein